MRARILTSQTISTTTNTNSVSTKYLDLLSVQVDVTAVSAPTIVGKIQVSEDDINWSDIDGSDFNISGIGTHNISVADYSHNRARLVFSVTSGSFTGQALVSGKERRS